MPISSTSTLAEVEAAYDDNASYEEDSSIPKCRAFQTAIRILLRRLPTESGTRETNARWDMALLSKELERAQCWQAANDDGTSDNSNAAPYVKRVSFENFRD